MNTSTAGYLLAGLAASLTALYLLAPSLRDTASHPFFQDARNIDAELEIVRNTPTTYRGLPPLPLLTPANSLFRECFPAEDNQPFDDPLAPDGLADNIDPRRIPWPPLRPGEQDAFGRPSAAVLARYELRFCDQNRPAP